MKIQLLSINNVLNRIGLVLVIALDLCRENPTTLELVRLSTERKRSLTGKDALTGKDVAEEKRIIQDILALTHDHPEEATK